MNQINTNKLIAYMALISGLSISAVAVYYSVMGLTAIFAAAVVPIIIMGVTLEISKLIATVWLKQNWDIAPATIKSYLIAAIAVLMIITSIGIFGFLSKAHLDQSLPSDDVTAQLSTIDEKIKTQRDNIDSDKKALAQMDAQVDQLLGRTTDDLGATKAAKLRKSQAKERASLQTDVAQAQQIIAGLNEERAPIAGQLRKVEAEVGPIKYIAAFFYGSTDPSILEKAVTWVIIILIVVFDPLAVILLLASQISFQHIRKLKEEAEYETDDGPLTDEQIETIKQASSIDQDLPNGAHLFVTEEEFFARGKEIARQADKIAQMEAELAASKQQQDEDPLDLWNKLLAAAEQPTESAQPITLPPQPHVWTTTIYPPVTDVEVTDIEPLAGYVQNEEQAESGLWQDISLAGQISEQEYYAKAAERTIEELVASVREGRLPLDKVPDEIRAQVTEKLENDR